MSEVIDPTPNAQRAVDAAVAATQPETFDFAAAVQGRSYPEFEVPIYLDERTIQRMLESDKARRELELRIAASSNPTVEQAEKLEYLDLEHEEAVESLKDQQYTVKIKGISPEASIKLEEAAYEKYPKEFEEVAHPFTGATTKQEIPNEDRETYYAALIRQAHVVSVTAPNGAVDTSFSDIEKVIASFARMPFVARAKVDQAINEATIAVDFYDELVDEVF